MRTEPVTKMWQQHDRRENSAGWGSRAAAWVLVGALGAWPAVAFAQVPPTQTPPTAQVATTPAAVVTPTVTAAPVAAVPAQVAATAAQGPRPAASISPVIMLRDIDREMTTLSNDITQSHQRLQQITSMVLDQSGGGAQLIIDHQNEMGSTFRLVRATYTLDGATIATRVDDNGSLADLTSYAVYNGRVASGEHSLTVSLEYQGNGYGIFSYIRGYTFRSRSVQTFTVPEGRALRLVVLGYEQGGATSALEDRPKIRYTQTVMTVAEAQALTSRTNAAPVPTGATPTAAPAVTGATAPAPTP